MRSGIAIIIVSGRCFRVHSLGGAKRILGCSSKTCDETVRGDYGLETSNSRRKLKWWHKVCSMPKKRFPKQFRQEWEIKQCRGR